MHRLPWQQAIDFLVLAGALYLLLIWARQARAMRVALWVVFLHAASLLARHFDLLITTWVLEGASLGLIIMLLFVFQAELRRAFMRLDRLLHFASFSVERLDSTCRALAEAAFRMAAARTGALMVIARQDSLAELTEDGVNVGADVTPLLLESIFQKTSPMHDGAAIIESDRISRVNVILPLTSRQDVPAQFGTRHRAAMGLSERSDALVVVVSEERGEVSLMRGRTWRAMETTAELVDLLENLWTSRRVPWLDRLRSVFVTNFRLKAAAAGLAAVVWTVSFFETGITLRTITVPLEFSNVPRGMDIRNVTAERVQVAVRGRSWIMDRTSLGSLVARVDMSGGHEGSLVHQITARDLNMPPGVSVDSVTPPVVSLRLVKR